MLQTFSLALKRGPVPLLRHGCPNGNPAVDLPDRPGLVSELSGWVSANGGNIRHADHHTDSGAGLFLSRLEWDLEGFGLPRASLPEAVQALSARLGGEGNCTSPIS